MKRIVAALLFSMVLVGYATAETCVTQKVTIAIADAEDYKNMIFTALGGEEATQAFARELVKQGKATFLLKGETLELVKRVSEASVVRREGKVWIVPSSTLKCK